MGRSECGTLSIVRGLLAKLLKHDELPNCVHADMYYWDPKRAKVPIGTATVYLDGTGILWTPNKDGEKLMEELGKSIFVKFLQE